MALAPHAIVFAAALTATVTGYGFVLLSSPLLLLLFAPAEAVPLSIMLGWLVIATLLVRPTVWRAIDRRQALSLTAAGIFGVPLGTALLAALDAATLRVGLGLIITTLALLSLAGTLSLRRPVLPPRRTSPVRLALVASPAGLPIGGLRGATSGVIEGSVTAPFSPPALEATTGATSESGQRTRQKSWWWTLGTGFCSGILSGCSGLSGPSVVLYLSHHDLDKHQLRATSAATIWLLASMTLMVLLATGRFPADLGQTSLHLVPSLAAGMVAGGLVFRAIPDRRFRQVTLGFAAAAGAFTALAGAAAV
jgi:uncharacterized membrane protein YfcA